MVALELQQSPYVDRLAAERASMSPSARWFHNERTTTR
jgi:hypothetical protein